MEDLPMHTTLLLLLAAACTQGIEDSETPVDTGETPVTEETGVEDPWEATFWSLQDGAWVEDRARVDAYVGGYSLAYGGDIGAGTEILRWSGAAWEAIADVDRQTPGPIDAYTGNGTDHYVAVGTQLYSWANPGQWGRWLEPTPGEVGAISYVGYSRIVAVGPQLYYFSTSDDTWYTTLSVAPGDIQCIYAVGGEEPATYVMAGTTVYQWDDESGWIDTSTPAAPFPMVGGCAMDSEGNIVLVTNKMLE